MQNSGVDSDAAKHDFLPPDKHNWTHEHASLLALLVKDLLRASSWPRLSDLTPQLAQEQLGAVFHTTPKRWKSFWTSRSEWC